MKARRLLIAVTVLALLSAPASHAQWFRISEGFSAIYELDQTSPAGAASAAVAMTFPKNQSLTTWFAVHPSVNAMVICHFLNVIPPEGATAPKSKIKVAKHRVISGTTQEQIASATTKGTGRKSCSKQLNITPGESSVFVLSTIKKVTKSFDAGTTIVPSVNVFPGIAASPVSASAEISADEFAEYQKAVRRYAESVRPKP